MPEGMTPQIKETQPNIDFRQIFREKLESIPPLSEQDSGWESEGFQDLGIRKIKRKIPAVIMHSFGNDNKLQLWITDPEKANEVNYVHLDVEKELESFLQDNNLNSKVSSSSAYLIQDNAENCIYFLIELWLKIEKKT